jgi:hypothetical protein
MTTTSKHPGEDVLREMASRPGMTFAKMARELAVDRKTVRRGCRDIGIDECGAVKPDPAEVSQLVSEQKPEAENIVSDDDISLIIQVLQNKQAWLTEWLTMLHERLQFFEQCFVGIACPLPGAQVELLPVRQAESDLLAAIMRIAFKLGAGVELDKEEQAIYDDLAMICRDALKEDVKILSSRIENHWHTCLSVAGSKEMARERRNGGNHERV